MVIVVIILDFTSIPIHKIYQECIKLTNEFPKMITYLKLAKNLGVQICLDGLGMLVNQAAASFQIWTGIEPETNRVLNSIKSSL